MTILNKLRNNGLLHKIHLWTDVAIGVFALVGLFWEGLFDFFIHADVAFHLLIATLAFGGIIAERVLHKHKGVIAE